MTAHKRCLEQGNIFTCVCHSVHRRSACRGSTSGGGESASRRSAYRVVCIRGGGWADPPELEKRAVLILMLFSFCLYGFTSYPLKVGNSAKTTPQDKSSTL